MHELSIALSIVDQIVEESTRRGGLVIHAVHLTLGMLSGVDQHALHFCFKSACEGTILEGARLIINTVPVAVSCAVCKAESTLASVCHLACPLCNAAAKVIRGLELEIASLVIAA